MFSYNLIYVYLRAKKYNEYDWNTYLGFFDRQNGDLLFENNYKEALATGGNRIKKWMNFIKKRRQDLKDADDYKVVDSLLQVVIVATYKEPLEILESSIGSVADSSFDPKKIILVLATEERDKEHAQHCSQKLIQKYGDIFHSFYTYMHPKNLPNEVPGKGGNITYSAKQVAKDLTAQHIDPSDVIVTTLDADNRVHKDYFANLAFHYLMCIDRKKKSYQPLPLVYNNVWSVPVFNRLSAISSSFWHMIQSGRPDKLRNFSSHSQSLDALIDMDYWNTLSIIEDGHQYWRAYFCYNGDHEVVPTFMPIYQDAVENVTYFKSVVCQYKQLRRWAWGCSDIAFVIDRMMHKGKKISFFQNALQLFRLIEGHFMWATAPLIITMAPFMPGLVNDGFNNTILAHNVPVMLSNMFSIALVGIFASIWVQIVMIPKPPKNIFIRISAFFQWIVFPISTILFGAAPAIDAQTRLLFNKRLDFNVTEKVRKVRPPKEVLLHQ